MMMAINFHRSFLCIFFFLLFLLFASANPEINRLISESNNLAVRGDRSGAKVKLDSARHIAQDSKDNNLIYDVMLAESGNLLAFGENRKTIEFLKNFNQVDRLSERQKAIYNLRLAISYDVLIKPSLALPYVKEAYDLAKANQFIDIISSSCNTYGSVLLSLRRHEEALVIFNEGIILSRKNNNAFDEIYGIYNVLDRFENLLNSDLKQQYIIDISKVLLISKIPLSNEHMGVLRFTKKFSDREIEEMYLKIIGDKKLSLQVYLSLSDAITQNLVDKNEYQTLINIYSKIYTKFRYSEDSLKLVDLTKPLFEAYRLLNRFDSAYYFQKEYIKLRDPINNLQSQIKADSLNVLYETEKKEKLIAQQDLDLFKAQKNKNRLLSLLLGLAVFSGMIIYSLRRRNALVREISTKDKEIQLQRIAQLEKEQKILSLDYMLMGEEKERKRIAEELHDGLGAILATARLQIQKIQSEIDVLAKMDLFTKAESLVDSAAKEVRRIAHDMMPEDLVKEGLVNSIKNFVDGLMINSPIDISYYTYAVDEDLLNDQQKVNIYRIVQELIQNGMRHSEGTSIIVQLTQEDNILNLTYEDNGIGFDPDIMKSHKGIGMMNIKYRTDYLNAKLNIDSKAGGPTIFEISVPLTLN